MDTRNLFALRPLSQFWTVIVDNWKASAAGAFWMPHTERSRLYSLTTMLRGMGDAHLVMSKNDERLIDGLTT